MSSRRRSRDRTNIEKASSKLRMDTKPQTPRITDPSLPAGRRREIDNVMKKARARAVSPTSNAYWDKKLLEVEAKDPNRWRHSGYKSLYLDGSSSPSPNFRSRSRSPAGGGRRSPRSPTRRRSPRSPVGRKSPRSPPTRRSPPGVGRRSPPSRRSPASYRSPMPPGRRSPPSTSRSRPAGGRPRSPPPNKASGSCRRSASASSISSCSDDSCSVCSPKNHRSGGGARSRSLEKSLICRSRSFSVPRSRGKEHAKSSTDIKSRVRPRSPPSPQSTSRQRMSRPVTPPSARKPLRLGPSDRPTDPRRQPPPPRPRGKTGQVIDVSGVKLPPKPAVRKPKEKGAAQHPILTRIKKEKTKKRPGSPDSSGSEDGSSVSSIAHHIVATTSLTLSERFGKIAQWSADRERREMENMRITKTGGDLKVMIEDELLYGSPPRRYSLSPVPAGHYPDELMPAGPSSRLAAWDDVRVRYQYYKELGYLRDLSMDDYVKWEEWWYKYQDWLANERHYEHWSSNQGGGGGGGGGRRRGRKRLPASQRLN